MSIFNRQKKEEKEKSPLASDKIKAVVKKTDEKTKPKGTKELYKQESNKKEVKDKAQKSKESAYVEAYKILVKPLITEKAANLGSDSKYVFAVSNDANKIEIAKSINQVYGIKPVRINIINVKGKKVRTGRILGKRKDWKKAVVTLPKGKTIKVYEGV